MPVMALTHTAPAWHERLTALRADPEESVRAAEVISIVEGVVRSIRGQVEAEETDILTELDSLAAYIRSARTEIAALGPEEIRHKHLPNVTDELDAVVGATAEATSTILTAAETVERVAGGLTPEASQPLTDAVTSIYEACNFQDITGQRISKVVKTLRHIESRIDRMILVFGEQLASQAVVAGGDDSAAAPDSHLMNGPQMPAEANKQDDIDAIMASFG
jgi:chemotaxis protein CheZ